MHLCTAGCEAQRQGVRAKYSWPSLQCSHNLHFYAAALSQSGGTSPWLCSGADRILSKLKTKKAKFVSFYTEFWAKIRTRLLSCRCPLRMAGAGAAACQRSGDCRLGRPAEAAEQLGREHGLWHRRPVPAPGQQQHHEWVCSCFRCHQLCSRLGYKSLLGWQQPLQTPRSDTAAWPNHPRSRLIQHHSLHRDFICQTVQSFLGNSRALAELTRAV